MNCATRLRCGAHLKEVHGEDFLPTRLGNVLRAAGETPYYKYGLDPITCWPHIWLILPAETQEHLNSSRQALDSQVVLFLWGLLFICWTWWWPWAILISIAWMVIAYSFAFQSAVNYTALVEAVIDLHWFDLYRSLHWPLPTHSGKTELKDGEVQPKSQSSTYSHK